MWCDTWEECHSARYTVGTHSSVARAQQAVTYRSWVTIITELKGNSTKSHLCRSARECMAVIRDSEKWNSDAAIWQLQDKGRNTAQGWSDSVRALWHAQVAEIQGLECMWARRVQTGALHLCGGSWERLQAEQTSAQKYCKIKQQRRRHSVLGAVDQGN